jgi:hypothetical protein
MSGSDGLVVAGTKRRSVRAAGTISRRALQRRLAATPPASMLAIVMAAAAVPRVEAVAVVRHRGADRRAAD